jgi:proteasome lid subunit RPN8/RPN11
MSLIVMLLEFKEGIWRSLMDDLRKRGNGNRESGAFLLGQQNANTKIVHTWLPYDELEPDSLNFNYVRLSSDSFTCLWDECTRRNLQVVGDVHTHPFGPAQSKSDRANPMVAITGHTAVIVPNFAQGSVSPQDVSINYYLGAKRWSSHFGQQAASLIKLL